MTQTAQEVLPLEKIAEIFSSLGAISKVINGFESRQEQQNMACDVALSYNRSGIALIEAGTGTGKSLAYAVPALLFAVEQKQPTVISTNTINLQEQLLKKDIPLAAKALNVEVKAVIVKGMSNYICKRKLQETTFERTYLSEKEQDELQKIEEWEGTTQEGSLTSLPMRPSSTLWEKVCAESDTCTYKKCPHYDSCHFIKARHNIRDANILITNHHLLFADLAARSEVENYQDPMILPPYQRIIMDEAHNIEDIATEYFGAQTSQLAMGRSLSRLHHSKKRTALGKLAQLTQMLISHYKKNLPPAVSALLNSLQMELPAARTHIHLLMQQAFAAFSHFVQEATPSEENPKLRLLSSHYENAAWKLGIVPPTQAFLETLERFLTSLRGIPKKIEAFDDKSLKEKTEGVLQEILGLAERLSKGAQFLKLFSEDSAEEKRVRWIELQTYRGEINTHLYEATLDISDALAENLFSKFSTVVLCSATLSTDHSFKFVKKRLGILPEKLNNRPISESEYTSPFNYKKQALLAVPQDLPPPHHPDFIDAATEAIWEAVRASRGNAFILFTSYAMLQKCYQKLLNRFQEARIPLLKQGDRNRQALLQQFREEERSTLFATDSFWEGVDVTGEALRLVVIVKLPFRVPSEPLMQARSEAILADRGNPFLEYAVPQAIVKFKQGVGRLIRHKRDRGCVVCLDSRLHTKHYGRHFLSSLPPYEQVFVPLKELGATLNSFYFRKRNNYSN